MDSAPIASKRARVGGADFMEEQSKHPPGPANLEEQFDSLTDHFVTLYAIDAPGGQDVLDSIFQNVKFCS